MTASPSQTENFGIEARYYAPPTFTSRDPLFEKYFWLSPYAYCGNNPVGLVDPSGMDLDIADNDETKNDLLSIVSKENRSRIIFDGAHVSVNTEGMSSQDLKKDIGLSLINDMCNSDKKFLFETSDFAFTRDDMGEPCSGTLETKGVVNASNGGLDDYGMHADRPRIGYDGQVVIAKSSSFYRTDGKEIRSSAVFHELAENYFRTHKEYNYNGTGLMQLQSAHFYAATLEPVNYYDNPQPGRAIFKSYKLTTQQKEDFANQRKNYMHYY